MPSPAPLADAVAAFLDDAGTTFTVPGHKRRAPFADALLSADLPLVSGAEDSRMTGGVLARAEGLAAAAWGADWCRFSVAGSTHGNQSLALAVGRSGGRVVVSRTLHKSLFAGLVLAGLEPVWVRPDVDDATGLALGVPVAAIEAALAEAPDACGVFVVEPSYVGVLSDRAAIVAAAHRRGVPVLVDQAWGAHLGFHPALPAHALAAGADAFVTSAHKNLTAFTQASLVCARTARLDAARLEAGFEALHTTSPSGAILGSIDRSRQVLVDDGATLLGRTIAIVAAARRRLLAIDGVRVVDDALLAHPSVGAVDPTKLVIALQGTGADGFAVEADLLAGGIRLEMADRDTLVPIVTMADDEGTIEQLVAALERSLERRRGAPRAAVASSAWSHVPERALSPREAFFAPVEVVPAERAHGRIAAETAAPYPPGIPVLAPGEVVTRAVLETLRAEAAAGSRVAYAADPTLATLRVVAR